MASGRNNEYDPGEGDLPERSRRGGVLVFLLVFFAIAVAIAAAVLLANDARNLKEALADLNIAWPFDGSPDDKTIRLVKKGRLKPATIQITDRILSAPDLASAGVFLREMRDLGPDVCRDFDEAGIENGGWKQSEIDRSTFECLTSEPEVNPATASAPVADPATGVEAAPEEEPSLFFIAKGDPDGEIRSIRMKLVLTGKDGDAAVQQRMIDGVQLLRNETGWADLEAFVKSIRSLSDLTQTFSGMSYSFRREFTNANRFNLIVMATNREPAVKRSRAYFDRKDWMHPVVSASLRWPFVTGQHPEAPLTSASSRQ